MFSVFKNIEDFRGIPPYASELYGVYQPLLGWQSGLTKQWLRRGSAPIDPRVRRILDARITPGPTHLDPDFQLALPLEPGSGRPNYTVTLRRDLGSELIKVIQAKVQEFVETHGGSLPVGAEWNELIEINAMMAEDGDLKVTNDRIRARLEAELRRAAMPGQPSALAWDAMHAQLLDLMRFESQISAFLLFHAEGQGGRSPDALAELYAVRKQPELDDLLRPVDPLAGIDPTASGGSLSPVGFVHIFRQYFFDLGTFLGEPVEHVWLAPGTTIELIEVSTRKTTVERATEESLEQLSRSERTAQSKDELADAVKQENDSSTKLGVSSSNTVNAYVYQGTVSANFGVEATRKDSRETAHKTTRESGEKQSSEIKSNFKSVFRTITETSDSRSRRYTITNPSDRLVNYELRRKMRRVGVQMQDIGTRLCWQVFVDDPGAPLGLAELVHLVESPDLSQLKEPEKLPPPATTTSKVIVPLPFHPILDYSNNRAQYELQGIDPNGRGWLGIIVGDEDDDDSQIVIEYGPFKFDPPQTGYAYNKDVRLLNVQGNKLAAIHEIQHQADGSFKIIMQRLNFGGENTINLEMEVHFAPTPDEIKRVETANAAIAAKFDAEKQAATKKAFLEAVRGRIEAASSTRARPSWDLREEERTIVYRALVERLMIDSWKVPDTAQRRRVAHVRSEIIRAIFDIDSLMYFVAPEWWMPRHHDSHLDLRADVGNPAMSLTDRDVVKFDGVDAKRQDNYRITEKSAPAKLGSSLGWLLQLDGDNLRNAFLNAPWVKAVIPIRPGRERAALNWLQAIEGHDDDGWSTPYLGNDDPDFVGKTVGEVLEIIADRLEQSNGDIGSVLQSDKVFEHGFDHLADGFDAAVAPHEVFSQWVSVLPTDQIVAKEYVPADLRTD